MEDLSGQLRALTELGQTQQRQIACLTGFIGTLLGALQAKSVLHPDDVETLLEIFEEISPGAKARAVQTILNAVRVTAQETPHLMEVDATPHHPPPEAIHLHRGD